MSSKAKELEEGVGDVKVKIIAVMGKVKIPLRQLVDLKVGDTLVLDRKLGELVDIFVNDRIVARGEIVVVDDGNMGVSMSEIVRNEKR